MPNFQSPSFWEASLVPVLLTSIPLLVFIAFLVTCIVVKNRKMPLEEKSKVSTISDYFIRQFGSIIFIFLVLCIVLPIAFGFSSFQTSERQSLVSQTKEFLNSKYEIGLDDKTVVSLTNVQTAGSLKPSQFDSNSSNYTPHQQYGEVEIYADKTFSTLRLVRDGDVLTLLEQKDDSAKEVTLRGK